MKHLLRHAALLGAALLAATGHAAEGGGSTYNGGVENFLTGAVPPPGFHLLAYGQYFSADQAKDNTGHNAPTPPDFKVRAAAVVARGIWVTPYSLLGGQVIGEAVLPLVDLKVTAGGQSQHKTGLGDLTLGAGLAYHHSASLHSVVALDVVLPTAGYSATAQANLGRNYVSYQPLYSVSLVNPGGFNADFKAVLNFNGKNKDTQYTSGRELFVDYAVGWGLGNGWVLGVGGYARQQFSDDRHNGSTVPNNRARAFAIGPSLAFNNGKGWFVTAKFQQEAGVRNTLRGSAFWLKAVVPL